MFYTGKSPVNFAFILSQPCNTLVKRVTVLRKWDPSKRRLSGKVPGRVGCLRSVGTAARRPSSTSAAPTGLRRVRRLRPFHKGFISLMEVVGDGNNGEDAGDQARHARREYEPVRKKG